MPIPSRRSRPKRCSPSWKPGTPRNELRFRPEARRDPQGIGDYIARDDRDAARRFVRLLREKCALLARNPHIGRERPEFRPGLRSFPVQSYVILYRVLDQTVEIVNVVHGSRDVHAMF